FLLRLPQAVRTKAAPTSTHTMALYRMKVLISSPQSHCAAVRQCGLSVHDRARPPVRFFRSLPDNRSTGTNAIVALLILGGAELEYVTSVIRDRRQAQCHRGLAVILAIGNST